VPQLFAGRSVPRHGEFARGFKAALSAVVPSAINGIQQKKAGQPRPALPISNSKTKSEVAGSHSTLLQILLVILFGAIECARWRDFSRNRPL